ncbi:mucin-19-like [Anopheles maculipalpis]|uniref:mucin-19-like n=1 Tax=Anopheles maculipalpis TaxID=1496333 RepID=UPI002158E413|nr:mucin-19-like [Anopheles maculipalpis]
MGGKQSRLEREQKHQLRKQKKEKRVSKGAVEGEKVAAGGSSTVSGQSENLQRLVTAKHQHLVQLSAGDHSAPDVAPIESALNVTERDTERVGRAECSNGPVGDGEEDGTKSSVTITICMLKMEPNAAGTEAEHITPTLAEEENVGVGGEPAVEDIVIADDLLSRRPQCVCLENGNFGACTDGACSCTTGSIDNRLNNNEHLEPTPTATPSASTDNANTMPSSNVPCPSVVTTAATTATPQPALSFMIGGHDPATISHLLHRLRHLHHHHHHHLHHHHHHHLMHLHHHLHHHHPVTGGGGSIADLPSDMVAPSNSTIDWRQHQWIPAGMMVGSSNGAAVRPATDIPTAGGGSAVGPGTIAPTASQLFMDIDIDLKDKLEGLKLGPVAAVAATAGQRSSNNNVTEESGEHPYSVGECPTCCAMAMAANATGSLGGLLGNSNGGGSGVAGSVANGANIYNGNAGEVEEKILNTSNQPVVTPSVATGGENVPEPAAVAVTSLATADNGTTVSHATNDQISTEPDNTQAGSSSVATSSAVGGSTGTAPISSGKDDAERTVALEDNSSKPTTTAPAAAETPTSSSSNAASPSTANTTSDSPTATTVTVGSVTPTVAAVSSSSSSSSSSTKTTATTASCCNRKSSSSAASTLFGSLSFAGRRSRSSNARTGSCCANTITTAVEGASSPEQQQRSRISWIPGSGHKQQRNSNGSKNVRSSDTPTSGGKAKKSNWPFSLKSSSGSGSSQSRTNGTVAGVHKQTTKASPVTGTLAAATAGASTSGGCTSPSTAGMSMDMSNSIVSAAVGSGSTLRGSSLITSAKLLKGETDKDDSCVCTAYRKVSESPPPPSSPVPTSVPAAGPSRVASPRPTESVEWLEEAIQGSGLLPLNLHMLSSLRSGNAGSTAASAQSIAGGVPAPMISLSPEPIPGSMLSNHHHHHHHAMAAALVADHHPSFFFSTAAGTSNHHHGSNGSGVGGTAAAAGALFGALPLGSNHSPANDVILLSDSPVLFDLTSDDFSVEDCDERARIQRELEIREGVDAPPNFHPRRLMSGGTIASGPAANHPIAFIYSRDLMQRGLLMANKLIQPLDAAGACAAGRAGFGRLRIHSQVDFIHCLVPDLQKITSCSFYWGKMDRYEAERLLEGKPEGTFLLRDSAQEEFLFSVSFRKYNRSLHARIEQFNHKFSFDSRDPGVFTASTVTGLLEHYKDPSCVMFFEPMLTFPLNRNFSFSLQQLCRAVIVSNTTYDGINELTLPKSLKSYLKEYHYRQRVRFRPMDEHLYSNA